MPRSSARPPPPGPRITSYNVCYTKLLRHEALAHSKEIDDLGSTRGLGDEGELLDAGEPIQEARPILVLTTESQGSVVEEGKKAGATGWIVKPFNNEKLLETIKKVIP